MGYRTLNSQVPHYSLRAGLQSAHGQIAIIGVPNRLNKCVIFAAHAKYRNVAMDRKIHADWPLMGDTRCTWNRLSWL